MLHSLYSGIKIRGRNGALFHVNWRVLDSKLINNITYKVAYWNHLETFRSPLFTCLFNKY